MMFLRLLTRLWLGFCEICWWGFLVLICWAFVSSSAHAADQPARFSMTFDRITVQQLVLAFYDQCEKRGLLFDPAVSKLEEFVTLRGQSMTCSQARLMLLESLERSGVSIELKGNFDVLRPAVPKDERDGWSEVIYRPAFRDAVELADLAQIAIRKGSFAHQRKSGVVQLAPGSPAVPDSGTNGASITAKFVDKLVFFGPPAEAEAVRSLLSRLDVPSPQVELKAAIYEFQKSDDQSSAVSVVGKLLGERLSLAVAPVSASSSGPSIALTLPNLEAALSFLDRDSRFRYVSRPTVLAKDGEPVRFFAGEDVRVAGAIVLDRNGNPIQSRETLSAGVTLEATPRIRGELVDLTLYQAVSNFAASASGEPSVLKRDLRSRLLMKPGSVYVIGGLQSSRSTKGEQRLFGWRLGRDDLKAESEVVLLLTVVPAPVAL